MMVHKKSFGSFVIGVILCAICVLCIVVIGCSVVDSLAEKSRLEAIGATVTMKFTRLFFAYVIAFIASGIIGTTLVSKNIRINRVTQSVQVCEDSVVDNANDLDRDTSNNDKNTNTQGKEFIPSRNVKTNGGLKINYGTSINLSGSKSNSEVNSSDNDSDISSSDSGFFSSGGDL